MSIKNRINITIPAVIQQLGSIVNPLILNFTNEKNKLLIFYFHSLYESEKQKDQHHIDPQNNITVSQLDDFVAYFLHHNYTFIDEKALLTNLDTNKAYIMLTFDDGYFNNLLALDVLNKYKVPAVFFITMANVLQHKSYWWDVIYKFRHKEGASLDKIRKEQAQLKNYKFDYIDNYIENNFGKNAVQPWSDIDRPFTPAELKLFADNPYVTIGNHTQNHSILTNYDMEEIRSEIELCNKALQDITGKLPESIAFPNGNFNDDVLEVSKQSGMKFIYTTQYFSNALPFADKLMLKLDRFMAKPTDIKNYGSFTRMGYSPASLYEGMKGMLKGKKQQQ